MRLVLNMNFVHVVQTEIANNGFSQDFCSTDRFAHVPKADFGLALIS